MSETYQGKIFDVQAHAVMPSDYHNVAKAIERNTSLTQHTTQVIVDDICSKLADNLDGEARRAALGSDNIQVVTINTFFPPLPPERTIEIVDRLNIWMAERTIKNPQLIGIASIPPPPALASAGTSVASKGIEAVRRAINDLGLKGLMMASNYDNVFLGDRAFDPYFALAEELKVPVIIHPAIDPVEGQYVRRKNIPTYTGYLNDQRTTLFDLILSGVYEKFPDIKIIATHLGGGILTSLGRFRALSNRFPTDAWYTDREGFTLALPHPAEYYVKKIYYDCNNADARDVLHAISVVGHSHLLTGSDFPWTDDTFTRQVLGQLDPSHCGPIAYENAEILFNVQ
ncbi:hypothetical protein BGW36DRAFT_405585 [Talaromyces proteolyticus]|uniref:Amidohydrolase-related domain-containing protein n=1 Tax=Talaromyces proteolyticus TaxID=1131652 RepID=A0AAD4KZV2_9EURO|nr:uncharacterized protein BGW36DRAFT_405585 [Talaromyces proteolyticus]KAH8700319.1 hypothetical protein BGW36DRAFT_405585 [Talaromyces proteolyticus]